MITKQPASTRGNLKLASHHLLELLKGFDRDALKAELKSDTASYLKVLDALLRLHKGMIELRLLEEQLRERRAETAAKTRRPSRKGGLSAGTLREIERLLGFNPFAGAEALQPLKQGPHVE